MVLFNIFRKKSENSVEKLTAAIKNFGAEKAFEERKKDIESLRQYDRGEKEIHAPDLRDIVRNI